MTCTATLTTATVEPCPENGLHASHPLGGFCVGQQHIELRTLTCDGKPPCPARHAYVRGATELYWEDSTPGATPHVDPLVTDLEFSEALAAFQQAVGGDISRPALMAALQAAAEARTP